MSNCLCFCGGKRVKMSQDGGRSQICDKGHTYHTCPVCQTVSVEGRLPFFMGFPVSQSILSVSSCNECKEDKNKLDTVVARMGERHATMIETSKTKYQRDVDRLLALPRT